MHRVQSGLRPSLFLCIKPLVEPVHCLIHPFIRERERGAFFLIIRSLFKAPGFRIYICGEGSAVPAVVGCKQIPHSLMASGKGSFFSPLKGTSLLSIMRYVSVLSRIIAMHSLSAVHSVSPKLPAGAVSGCCFIFPVSLLYHWAAMAANFVVTRSSYGARFSSSPALSRISWRRSKLLSSKIRLLFHVS